MEQTFKSAWVQARYFRLSSNPSSLACLLTVSAAAVVPQQPVCQSSGLGFILRVALDAQVL